MKIRIKDKKISIILYLLRTMFKKKQQKKLDKYLNKFIMNQYTSFACD